MWEAVKAAPWLAYVFCVQNLFHLALPPALGPSWALAIEEQYYFLWAPVVSVLRRPWMLATVLVAALIASPMLRHANLHWMTPTNTLIHLDGIALGSLLALAVHTLPTEPARVVVDGRWRHSCWALRQRQQWPAERRFWIPRWPWVLLAQCWRPSRQRGARSPLNAVLRRGPLPFYGRISYGLYMTHISVFIYFGWFDVRMNAYGTAGNLAVVAFRLAMTTLVATVLWYGFESQILKLKRFF